MLRNFFPLMDAVAAVGSAGGGGGAAAAVATQAAGGAAAAAPAAWHAGVFKPDGAIDHTSFERLPDNFKHLTPTLSTLKTGDDLLAKIDSLNKLAGRKGLAPLPANATPEDIAAQQAVLRAVNGTPEKPDGYAFAKPADLPDSAWDPAFAKEAQEVLHKHNGGPGLAKDLLALQTRFVQGSIAAQQQMEADFFKGQDNEFRDALKKTGDDYDKVLEVVNRTATTYGIAADSPLLKNSQVRLLLHNVAKAVSEPSLKGDQGGAMNTKSDQALAESIVHDKTNPDYEAYWNPAHAKNAEVRKRVMGHYEAAAKLAQQTAGGARR